MDVKIIPIDSQAGVTKFVKCQWKFYKNDPLWVPPLVSDRLKILDTHKNPFFKHSKIQLFLAYSKEEIVGRIAAITNDNHNKMHNDKVGFWGFFECIDNQDIANALFDAAGDWLRSQKMDTMLGPENPSINDDIGLLSEGFDSSPVFMMTYNPRYYLNLVENYGFKQAKELYAYVLPPGFESEKLTRVMKIVREKYDFKIREVNMKSKSQFRKDYNDLKDIYNAAWQSHWGAVKWTDEEMEFLAADLKMIADPKTAIFLEYKGKTIAFALSLPNFNECFIHNKRGTMLGALWHMMTKKSKIKFTRIIALGILPEYQKMGFDAVLFYEIGHRALETGRTFGEASWILEDNLMMNRSLTQVINSTLYKKYRLYDKSL